MRDPVQSSLPLMNLLSTNSELVLCRVTGNNGSIHHMSQQSLICFVIHGEPESTRLRLDSPILPRTPPPPAHKGRGSVNTRTTEAVCCLKSDVCPDFLLNCVFCDCEQIEPYLPYEFTCEGMLQRVNAFIENQVLKLKYQTAQICKI